MPKPPVIPGGLPAMTRGPMIEHRGGPKAHPGKEALHEAAPLRQLAEGVQYGTAQQPEVAGILGNLDLA